MKTINNIIFDTSAMASALTVRQFTVIGEPGAQFTMTVTNEDNHFYNFSEERDKNGDLKVALAFAATPARLQTKTISENGFYTGEIQFPAITDDDSLTKWEVSSKEIDMATEKYKAINAYNGN